MIRKLSLDDIRAQDEGPEVEEVRALLHDWIPRNDDGSCDFYNLGDKIGVTVDEVIGAGGLVNYVPKLAARILVGDAADNTKKTPVGNVIMGLLNAVSTKDWFQSLLQGFIK